MFYLARPFGKKKKRLPVPEFLDRGLELIKRNENSEISLSDLPDDKFSGS